MPAPGGSPTTPPAPPRFSSKAGCLHPETGPGNLVPLDDLGTVYPTLRITDAWGILTVNNGALLNTKWTRVTVPAPAKSDSDPIIGEGWQLDLNAGWKLLPAERPGDYRLTPAE